MKEEKLLETMADIEEKYIIEARTENTKKKPPVWMKWVATAACLCLVIGAVMAMTNKNKNEQGSGNYIAEGNVQDFGQEEAVNEKEGTQETVSETDENSCFPEEDQPVQNEVNLVKSYDDIWGGSYLDESGRWVVWLTENTVENQQMVFERNPDLTEDNVIFQTAKYSLAYLNEVMENISEGMMDGKLPYVTSAMLREQTNSIEVYLTTSDEDCVSRILSFDSIGGAIDIVYSDSNGMEEQKNVLE